MPSRRHRSAVYPSLLLQAILASGLILLVASTSFAQDACDNLAANEPYQELVQAGVGALKNGAHEPAYGIFASAQAICAYDPGLSYYMARAKHLGGDCEAALGLYDQALEHFKLGKVRSEFPVAAVEERRAEAQACFDAENRGTLVVRCADEGVELEVADGAWASCPFEGEVTAGQQTVRARRAKHKPQRLEATVVRGGRVEVSVPAFEPLDGQLVLACDLAFEGVLVGSPGGAHDVSCPGKLALSPGNYTVQVRGGATQQVSILPGETVMVNVKQSAVPTGVESEVVSAQSSGAGSAGSEPPAVVPGSDGGSSLTGWVVAGTGLALAVTGTALLFVAESERADVADASTETHLGIDVVTEYRQVRANEKLETADTLGTVGWVALGVGGAALVTGAVLLMFDDAEDEHALSAVVWGSGGGVVWQGRF